MKRTLRNYNPLHRKPVYTVMSNRVITMHSKCAHCGENPILPHHMGCAHIFCYVCLKVNSKYDLIKMFIIIDKKKTLKSHFFVSSFAIKQLENIP